MSATASPEVRADARTDARAGATPEVSADAPPASRIVPRLYPFLLGAVLPMATVADYPRLYSVADAVGFALCVAALAALAFALAYLLFRRRLASATGDAAALVALGAVALFYSPLPFRVAEGFVGKRPLVAALAGVIAVAAAALLVVRWRAGGRRDLWPAVRAGGRFLTLFGALLVSWSVFRIGRGEWTGAAALRRTPLTATVNAPVPVRPGPPPGGAARRDIYVFVLDAYARADVLRDRFGSNIEPFQDSLRALGFTIPAQTRSNYAVTVMSVGSLLNFEHVWPLASVMPWADHGYAPAAHMINHPRSGRFLKSRGYQFVFFPSAWYTPTRRNPDADVVYDPYHGLSPWRAMWRSELVTHLAESTLLDFVLDRGPTTQEYQARHALLTFEGVAQLARRPANAPPVFSVAHLLMPHVPRVVDAACRPLPRGTALPGDAPAGSPKVRAAMDAELSCLNRELLTTIRALLARPGPRPVIILQGDHGSQSLNPWKAHPNPYTVAQSRERFAAFGAYLLPDGGGATLPDTVSIVNVMRYVFGYYFNADLPPEPNTMYGSHWRYPYALTEIDTVTYEPRRRAGR